MTEKKSIFAQLYKKTMKQTVRTFLILIILLCIYDITIQAQSQTFTPGVYWINDPDAEFDGNLYARTLIGRCVRLTGTDSVPENTVLAVSRGHTQGAIGNYTMFLVKADTLIAENLTFGNYCNVDLIYAADKSKNRKRRAEAVVQSQIGVCNGTQFVYARNCRFISRLNMCNFVGARKALFEDCYIECGDDALAGNATYRNCTLVFYSSKPFYSSGRGATFENCDIHIRREGHSRKAKSVTQYFTKVPSPVTLDNVRIHSDIKEVRLGWTKDNNPSICKAVNVTLNGKEVLIDTIFRRTIIERHPIPNGTKIIDNRTWVFSSFKPSDTKEYTWEAETGTPAWYYGTAQDGAEGHTGYIQNTRGAQIIIDSDTDAVSMTLCPCKTAGQGFGSATGQYLDICICMDSTTLTGYGLRFQRSKDYDHAVVTSLVRYTDGIITHITEPKKCELYKTPCKVTLHKRKSRLHAVISHGKGTMRLKAPLPQPTIRRGCIIIQHTGTPGASATLIEDVK